MSNNSSTILLNTRKCHAVQSFQCKVLLGNSKGREQQALVTQTNPKTTES